MARRFGPIGRMLTYHPPPPRTSRRCSSSFARVPTKTPGKLILTLVWAIRLMPCFVYRGLLKKPGLSVDVRDKFGNTPLHFTVQYGFNALGDFLVDKGANRDARNDEGKTPYEGL